jgi:hypothetical protein
MRSATSKVASIEAKRCLYAPRIGLAKLSKIAFDGGDLRPLWQELMAKVSAGNATAGDGLDLSVIAQLLGDKDQGLEIQSQVLAQQQLFRPPCASATPRLRVLALAAAMDMGGNMPIEFLVEDSDIELMTLYIVPGIALPEPLPDHDVAIVIASDSDACREALLDIARLSMSWPRPLLNAPGRICNLDRDKLHRLLSGVPGLAIPATARVAREQLTNIARSGAGLAGIADGLVFPITVRPTGSHAGFGLAKVWDAREIEQYLREQPELEFFVSQFIDYASDDGLFRKYRITFVDGQPYAVHMAISEQWKIWYLNAEMKTNAAKRAEEAEFMETFDDRFGARHRGALAELAARINLDYFTIDCAETRRNELLIFEADNTCIVHNMDPPEIFPYKPPQMRKIFDAFAAMLIGRGGHDA